MYQSFTSTTSPEQGPPRLEKLRNLMKEKGFDAFIVPKADVHQGEYVAPCDERLAWLSGFTGSAGFSVIAQEVAAIFVDGRYKLQVREQVADCFTPVDYPQEKLGPWIAKNLSENSVIAFDPWLHTTGEIEAAEQAARDVKFQPTDNLIDQLWQDRPPPPNAPAFPHPIEFAGEKSSSKRERLAKELRDAGQKAATITLTDSICWLLNIRGNDIPRNPIVQALAILHDDAHVSLFAAPEKFASFDPDPNVSIAPKCDFSNAIKQLEGPVRVDKMTAPYAIPQILKESGVEVMWGDDPCIFPKARKNETEIEGMRNAHLRDAAAMAEFLCWLASEAPKGGLTEISAAQKLEAFRRGANELQDISFDTISGAGPNGAIMHYRVTEETNSPIKAGDLYLVDSGGQYLDGTTDITRTIAVGQVGDDEKQAYTRVLQGLIAISTARFPKGLAGRDIDALARAPLWRAGQDFDHGTGHGVGAYLCVHEGPQRISRISEVPLEPGMILSNEPGYYRPGAFGIRLENLIVTRKAASLGDNRDQHDFETLTFAPFDRNLVLAELLAPWELEWLNAYHAQVFERVSPRVSQQTKGWLAAATAPL